MRIYKLDGIKAMPELKPCPSALRVAAYARVSTGKDEQQTSLESQKDYYEKKIKENPQWVYAGMYADDGRTGTSYLRRLELQRLMGDCRLGLIDMVITKSISRFARNTVDALTHIRELKEMGIGVYFEREDIWTLDAKGEFMITLLTSLAQEESRSLSENVTWGKRKLFADGKYSLTYSRFLGYDKGFVINEEEALVVRLIYRMSLQGYSAYAIADKLSKWQIKTPQGKGRWHGSVVGSILRNEKYKGDALIQKFFTKDFLTHELVENRGEIPQYYVEGHHEGIVTPEQFDQVQAEILRRQGMQKYSGVGLFSSIIKCAECGSWYGAKVWHSNDKYRKVIYQCNKKYKDGHKCQTPHITEEELKTKFIKAANELFSEKKEMLANTKIMMEMVCDTEELEKAQADLIDELNIITEQIEKAIAENSKVALDQTEYEERYSKLAKRYETVKGEYEETAGQIERKKAQRELFKGFIRTLENTGDVIEEFEAGLWSSLVQEVVVQPGGELKFVFKNGAEITE